MKLSTIRAAAKLFGLTAKFEAAEDPETGDDDVVLSNGVRIQMSGCGTPVGIHCITEIPEWTSFDKYWEGVPSAAAIIIAAVELKKKVDVHNAEHAKETSNV